jgi:hypothetical protein
VTTLTTPSLSSIEQIPKAVATWASDIVEVTHKQAAAVWGLLATAGVVGTPAGHEGGFALLAYAVVAHVAEKFLKS